MNPCTISCSYSAAKPKVTKGYVPTDKKHNVRRTTNAQIRCPFAITFSPFGKLYRNLQQVRVTECNAIHLCPMSAVSLTNVITIFRGYQKLDLKSLFDAISVLRIYTQLPAQQLRLFLINSMPRIQPIDSKFIKNRMKVALYHTKNTIAKEMALAEGMKLLKNTKVTLDDAKILEVPLVCLNF